MDFQEKIKNLINQHKVVLFMKGSTKFPMCGFSGKAIELLKLSGVTNPHTVDVLMDDDMRKAIKEFSNWPTIPQLYVNGEFMGGSDIMNEMYELGELQSLLSAHAS